MQEGDHLSFRAGDSPGGTERGEESPAETADERTAATGWGFLAVLSPSGASAARN